MITNLGGNAASVAAYQAAVGKVITSMRCDDDALTVNFADGTKLRFTDEGQSCCEHRYIRTDDDGSDHIGATFVGAELADAPDVPDEHGEAHEVQFLRVTTSAGVFVASSHNEHNGYYGGFAIRCSA